LFFVRQREPFHHLKRQFTELSLINSPYPAKAIAGVKTRPKSLQACRHKNLSQGKELDLTGNCGIFNQPQSWYSVIDELGT
jgi:hypothetical protein